MCVCVFAFEIFKNIKLFLKYLALTIFNVYQCYTGSTEVICVYFLERIESFKDIWEKKQEQMGKGQIGHYLFPSAAQRPITNWSC